MLIIHVLADAQEYIQAEPPLFVPDSQRIEGASVILHDTEYSVPLHADDYIIAVSLAYKPGMFIDVQENLFQTQRQFSLKTVGDVLTVKKRPD